MKSSHWAWIILGAGCSLAVVAAVSEFNRRREAGQQVSLVEPEQDVDSQAKIRVPEVGKVLVLREPQPAAITAPTLRDALKANMAGDTIGMQELVDAEKVFILEFASRVRVLNVESDLAEVRVESGKHKGKAAWVLASSLTDAVEFVPRNFD